MPYGILVQTALLDDKKELNRLYDKFLVLELPTTLKELGVDINDRARIDRVINASIDPKETISLLPFSVDNELLYKAIQSVENLSK